MTDEEITRFWSYVSKSDGCWIWTGTTATAGYGSFRVRNPRRMIRAHRLAYELTIRQIPAGMVIDHLCRNPSCVNPSHMEVVTDRENILRGVGETAKNAQKTHCPRGHPLVESYKDRFKKSHRFCRICTNALQRKYYHARLKERK